MNIIRFIILSVLIFWPDFAETGLADEVLPVPRVQKGTLSIGAEELEFYGPVALDGEWEWYPGQLLKDPVRPGNSLTLPVSLPPEESTGYGTLTVSIDLPPGRTLYGLKIPYLASAYQVFINGTLSGSSGSLQPYNPQYRPAELFFESGRSPVKIVIHVANSHHRRMRLNRIYLGKAAQISHMTHQRIIRDALLFGSLLMLSLYHLLVFFLHRQDRAFLYFAGIAGLTAVRLGIIGERILVRIWDGMPAELMMKLGYAPVFLLLPLVVLYLRALSSATTLNRAALVSHWAMIGSVILIITTPLRVYDAVFQYSIIFIALGALYVIYLVLKGPVFASSHGTVVIVSGGLIILLTGISDYFRELGTFQASELLSLGIVVFLLLQAYFLAWRFKTAYQETKQLATEVQRLNYSLETRILERTRALGEANQRLERISHTDGLTDLSNRRYFDEIYRREWLHALREGRSIAVIMADIDFFKAYNDSQGHLAGDDCLRLIAGILKGAARRATDVVARYGGEEFVILMPGSDIDTALETAESLRRQVEEECIPHPATGNTACVTISLGCSAITPESDKDAMGLLECADTALYRAKEGGRNRVHSAFCSIQSEG